MWTSTLTVVDAGGLSDDEATTVTFTPGDRPVAVITAPVMADETYANKGKWRVKSTSKLPKTSHTLFYL